jgi:hypothetical protein
VLVSVADCGVGISAKDADWLFNAVFTTKASAMGMGLSISRSIIEAHGGRLGHDKHTSRRYVSVYSATRCRNCIIRRSKRGGSDFTEVLDGWMFRHARQGGGPKGPSAFFFKALRCGRPRRLYSTLVTEERGIPCPGKIARSGQRLWVADLARPFTFRPKSPSPQRTADVAVGSRRFDSPPDLPRSTDIKKRRTCPFVP